MSKDIVPDSYSFLLDEDTYLYVRTRETGDGERPHVALRHVGSYLFSSVKEDDVDRAVTGLAERLEGYAAVLRRIAPRLPSNKSETP